MKTKFLTLFFVFLPILLCAQNYEKEGDDLFAQALYEKAAKKYSAAIEMSGISSSLQAKKEKCIKCASLLSRAKSAEASATDVDGYEKASKLYSDLFAVHALPAYRNKTNALKQQVTRLVEEKKAKSTLIIEEGTTEIADYAYRNNKEITTVIIPNSVIRIGVGAFQSCTNLTSIIIPEGVVEIDHIAFSFCENLTSVTISSSVITIGETVFSYCKNLETINVANNNPQYCSINGVLFSKKKDILKAFPMGRKGSYTIPNGVKIIGCGAFSGSEGLTTIICPNSITTIETVAFSDCKISSLTLPYSLETIELNAFCGCTNLNIKVPAKFRRDEIVNRYACLEECKSVTYY